MVGARTAFVIWVTKKINGRTSRFMGKLFYSKREAEYVRCMAERHYKSVGIPYVQMIVGRVFVNKNDLFI
jgi:hypothetical protein